MRLVKKASGKTVIKMTKSEWNRLNKITQVKKIDESWFNQGSFEAYKNTDRKEPFEIAKEDGRLKTLEGEQSYKKGFYIMTGPKGERYSIPPEEFKKLKTDNGDGTASPKKIVKRVKIADHDGSVRTSWGEKLDYKKGVDYIVRHGDDDYGVVKKDIFDITYKRQN